MKMKESGVLHWDVGSRDAYSEKEQGKKRDDADGLLVWLHPPGVIAVAAAPTAAE